MISIAVDGYSGSGKGELCKGLAKKFNLKHLDSGAILRAIGLYFYRKNITEITDEVMNNNIDNVEVEVEFENDLQHTKLNGEDVSKEIRTETIGQMASKVAIFPKAMHKLIVTSQKFASKNDCIIDGRNITSEVLPNATVKLFLTADVKTRALRRYTEDKNKGIDTNLDDIVESLKKRDWRDTHREFSAMVIVPDAVVVDNTNLTIDETIDFCADIVREKILKK